MVSKRGVMREKGWVSRVRIRCCDSVISLFLPSRISFSFSFLRIHCFEGVRAILFIASLNEFDQMLAEDMTKNRLTESLQLFEGIIHLPWFQKTSIILFLNKHDLFKQKIKTVDIGAYFPQYSGGNNYEDALIFMKELFFSRNTDSKRSVYAHCTDATDTHGMRFVWKATKHIVMKSNLLFVGLI